MHLAQHTEQFAVGMRRFVFGFLELRLTDQLADVLAVGVRKLCHEAGQRGGIAGDQLVAQGFNAVRLGHFPAHVGLVEVEQGAPGIQGFRIFLAHLLGHVLQLPLFGDLRGNFLAELDVAQHLLRDRHLHQARHRDFHHARGQFQHSQGRPAFFAAAGA